MVAEITTVTEVVNLKKAHLLDFGCEVNPSHIIVGIKRREIKGNRRLRLALKRALSQQSPGRWSWQGKGEA